MAELGSHHLDHLYGLNEQHLVEYQDRQLEVRTAEAFLQLQQCALQAGFDLQICSAYRGFERQCAIWNAKAQGRRPLLDAQSKPIDFALLSPEQIMQSILIWSAFPGSSRHHWGTDIDVFDANNINQQQLKLVTDEYLIGGPCYEMHRWLMAHAHEFGFYFPFQAGLSGVSPEPWHLSYYPVAQDYLERFDHLRLKSIINCASVDLKPQLLAVLPQLIDQYVSFVAPIPKTS
ncbi:M15 family metallopeptidase [Shewanella intestini]|uniref:M15 family metallopeptidase n=1 Tax=Shewanella intestini TaxID=2017544 RepID=A0ABS5I143_9GAMM|nr:M15 family metallopeptidase [Shewanella intestini]MRG35922.1 D-alanyl-D-alanine carboxypeptidase family protein [Shewanella sp. XMDDZSB0408]